MRPNQSSSGRPKPVIKPTSKKAAAAKKAANSKTTRVSAARSGAGASPKPTAKRVSPSKRGEGSTNSKATVAMKKKQAKVQEAGVANVAGTVIKGAIAVGKRLSPAAKTAQKNAKAARIQKDRNDFAIKMEKQRKLMLEAEKRKKIDEGYYGRSGRAEIDYTTQKSKYEAMRELWKSHYSK